jgi:hypothetical protein
MKGRWLWLVIVANLLALVALAFVYPNLMVGPGPLGSGHSALATDCFACHAPLRGASADRCITCHLLPDIGLRTTRRVAIRAASVAGTSPLKTAFHQQLAESNCVACHTEHAGPRLTRQSRTQFSHALLRAQTRDRCESCHTAPATAMHRNQTSACIQCHKTEAWKPATFAHDQHFVLDSNHNASCVTCHTTEDYSRYTCYGCHEHTPANVSSKHSEEGIRDFENCVACHRSANGEREGKGSRENAGKGNRRERD